MRYKACQNEVPLAQSQYSLTDKGIIRFKTNIFVRKLIYKLIKHLTLPRDISFIQIIYIIRHDFHKGTNAAHAWGSPCNPGHASAASSGEHRKTGWTYIACRSASSVLHCRNHLSGENSRSCCGEHPTNRTAVKHL